MREEARLKSFVMRLFTSNLLIEHIRISSQSCSDELNDTSGISLGNSGLNRISY